MYSPQKNVCIAPVILVSVYYVGSVYVGGYGSLSESGLCVFRKLCPVSFLVVDECPSVLL